MTTLRTALDFNGNLVFVKIGKRKRQRKSVINNYYLDNYINDQLSNTGCEIYCK